ncbi:MAG TPA: FkbM family methyltransferase [Actinomycetota bacterium]|nr:FkbM family methyltransferase [Actinomycetota bacterium]
MEEAVRIEVDGLVLAGTGEHRDYLERVRHRRREALMANLLRDAAAPGMTVVDVGAFLGYFSLVAALEVGPGGRVLAFEPDPRDFPWLERNVALNGMGDRITPLLRAAVDRQGTTRLFLAEGDQSQTSIYPGENRDQGIEVACTSVDVELGGEPAGLIKIDVEGAELRALRGMERTLEAAGRDVTLFVEWNPGALLDAGEPPDAVPRRLEELGFKVRMIDEEQRTLRAPGPFRGAYANLYCTRR